MKLIPEWKKAPRMFSMQAMGLAIAIQGAWEVLPNSMLSSLPDSWVRVISVTLLVLGIIGRLVEQKKVRE